jgi:hypothetical protein
MNRLIIVAAVSFLASLFPAYGAELGCDLKPEWLCYMNSTWWQGRSEDAALKYILAVCRDTPTEIICEDQAQIIHVQKRAGVAIQWSGIISGPQDLASVISAMSPTASGQFAIAATMYNRLKNGAFGASISQVVTPQNFNGFITSTSPEARKFGNDIWKGNAPSGGTTGNALYYAAPSSANAPWAKSLTK